MYSHNSTLLGVLFIYSFLPIILRFNLLVIKQNRSLFSRDYPVSTISIISTLIALILYQRCASKSYLYNKITNKDSVYAVSTAKNIDDMYIAFIILIVISVISVGITLSHNF